MIAIWLNKFHKPRIIIFLVIFYDIGVLIIANSEQKNIIF